MLYVVIDIFERLLYLCIGLGFFCGGVGFVINSYHDYPDVPFWFKAFLIIICLGSALFFVLKGVL